MISVSRGRYTQNRGFDLGLGQENVKKCVSKEVFLRKSKRIPSEAVLKGGLIHKLLTQWFSGLVANWNNLGNFTPEILM